MSKENKSYFANGSFCRVFMPFKDAFFIFCIENVSKKILDKLPQFQLAYHAVYSQQRLKKIKNEGLQLHDCSAEHCKHLEHYSVTRPQINLNFVFWGSFLFHGVLCTSEM